MGFLGSFFEKYWGIGTLKPRLYFQYYPEVPEFNLAISTCITTALLTHVPGVMLLVRVSTFRFLIKPSLFYYYLMDGSLVQPFLGQLVL
jgi:hypothetical protein